jgi:hypothetical protein
MNIEPYIKNLKDFVDADKVLSNHPFVVGDLIRQEIEEWRANQQQVLIDNLSSVKSQKERELMKNVIFIIKLKEINNLKYAVPPKYRFPVSL